MKETGKSSPARTTLAIEQEVAKELLLMYQQRRSFGGRKLETAIYRATGRPENFLLTREDIYNWLVGRTKRLGEEKFKVIEAFILTDDFAKVVPQAKAIYAPLKNTVDIGCSFSQVHGYVRRAEDDDDLTHLNGLWLITPRRKTRDSIEEELLAWLTSVDWGYAYAFMYVQSIVGYDFSVAHFIRGDGPPHYLPGVRASGFVFPKNGTLHVKVWNRANRQESRHELKSESAASASDRSAQPINTLLIDLDFDDAPADRVLSAIAPLTVFMPASIKAGLRSKPPYFAYRCSSLIQRAEYAPEDDPLWIVDLKEQAFRLQAVQKLFDSFLWSVIPDGITK